MVNHETMAAAKGAVEGLVQAAAASFAPRGIRVKGIAPGLMRTPATEHLFRGKGAEEQRLAAQYPLGRFGSIEDAADAMAWLMSDEARWVTGQVLAVDGGFSTIRPLIR